MHLDLLKKNIYRKLEQELPSDLTYHSLEHTKNVVSAAVKLGELEAISQQDLLLVETAAVLHDTGYLEQYDNNEEIGCRIARKELPDYGYDSAQIEKICRIIMATQLPQSPFDLNSKIICDADLFYLGTDDYQHFANMFRQEMANYEKNLSDQEWMDLQIRFLTAHSFFTESAKKLLTPGKTKHLQALIACQEAMQ